MVDPITPRGNNMAAYGNQNNYKGGVAKWPELRLRGFIRTSLTVDEVMKPLNEHRAHLEKAVLEP